MARQIDIMQLGFRGYGLGIWVTCGFDKIRREGKEEERKARAKKKKEEEV